MMSRFKESRAIPLVLWILSIAAIARWSQAPDQAIGWDFQVYVNALVAQKAGHDPYSDGMAVQRAFHAHLAEHRHDQTPFTYVYSPLTLPVLRVIGLLPFHLAGTIYWLLYACGTIAAIWVGMQLVDEGEKWVFALLAPLALFFPGLLLQTEVLFSGNIAYILYGLILTAAWVGWRRGKWGWFYVAVLAASCCKAPLLYLLAIPVLSARRQWIPAGVAGAAGCLLFALQPQVWPTLFSHYLEAVELQFSFNHDFGSGPAGQLAGALYDAIPYQITSAGFYLFYAPLFAGVLLYLRKRFLAGEISQKQWIPVMLVGVFLLNPRIMEYDAAPITVPLALVVWRVLGRGNTLGRQALEVALVFLAANQFATSSWRRTECLTLVGVFFAGSWNLFLAARDGQRGDLVSRSALFSLGDASRTKGLSRLF